MNFSIFSSILVSIRTVFDHISKHFEVRQKHAATRRIINSLHRNVVKHGRSCLIGYFENDDFFMCAFHSIKDFTTLQEFYSRNDGSWWRILLKFSLNLTSSFYPKKKKIISFRKIDIFQKCDSGREIKYRKFPVRKFSIRCCFICRHRTFNF